MSIVRHSNVEAALEWLRQRGARGLAVEVPGVLEALGLRPELGEHRHLPRERGAEGVDGLDAKPRRVLLEAPAEAVVALERGAGEVPGERPVVLPGPRVRARLRERREDAPAHLGRGLAGEGDRGDLARR
jgi:hypothetical protein